MHICPSRLLSQYYLKTTASLHTWLNMWGNAICVNTLSDKIFFGQNILADKIFDTKNFVRFLPDFCFEMLGKIFDGQNVSSNKIFDTKLKFWHFCPTNFCPIRYCHFCLNSSMSSLLKWRNKVNDVVEMSRVQMSTFVNKQCGRWAI